MKTFFKELKRRNIYRVSIAYLVVAWLILQAGAIASPALNLPEWTITLILLMLVAGFPVAIILAWAFELTPEGLKRSAEVLPEHSITSETRKKLNRIIIGVLALAVVVLLVERFFFVDVRSPVASGTFGSIAVLPFVNMSDDPNQEYFSDGVSEEILNLLAKLKQIRVAARTSSFSFKGTNNNVKTIGKELGVDTILEGSVRKSGNKLRITAQLIEADTGYHLWSDTYNRELTDIFAIQYEISAAIVKALQLHLAGEDLTLVKAQATDIEAYNAYLKGRQAVDTRIKQKLYEALAEFDRATQIDPNYAPAYAAKAEAYMHLSADEFGDLPPEQAINLATSSLERALALDPNLADVHATKGLIALNTKKYNESLVALNRAIELSPNLARAYVWRSTTQRNLGYKTKALGDLEFAYQRNPLYLPVLRSIFFAYVGEHEDKKAYEILERFREKYGDKNDFDSKHTLALYESVWIFYQGEWANVYNIAMKFVNKQDNDVLRIISALAFILKNEEIARDYINYNFTPFWEFWFNYDFGNREGVDKALEKLEGSSSSEDKEFLPFGKIMRLTMNGDEASIIEAAQRTKDLDESFGGVLFGPYPVIVYAPHIIALKLQSGDEVGANRLTEQLRVYVKKYERGGHDWGLGMAAISLKVLDHDYEGALNFLEKMANNYADGFDWTIFNHPILKPIHNHARYQTLKTAYYEHINKEREKLGWEPVAWGSE